MNISYCYFRHPATKEMIAPGELYTVDTNKLLPVVNGNKMLKKGREGTKSLSISKEDISEKLDEDKTFVAEKVNVVKQKSKKRKQLSN